jgi:hypothetical protein
VDAYGLILLRRLEEGAAYFEAPIAGASPESRTGSPRDRARLAVLAFAA